MKRFTASDVVRVVASSVTLVSTLMFMLSTLCLCGGILMISTEDPETEEQTEFCHAAGLTADEVAASARHEAGHTVVTLALHPEWFEQTDLFPYGLLLGETCATGITSLALPADMTRDDIRDHIAITYGGYVADLHVRGQPTTGASRDLRVATSVAIEAIDEMGMGGVLQPYNYGILRQEGIWVGNEMGEARDMEIRRLLDEGILLATEVLSGRWDEVDVIGAALADAPRLTLTALDVTRAIGENSVMTEDDSLQSYE